MNIVIKSIKNETKSPYTQQQYHKITIRKKLVANQFKVMLLSKIKTIEKHVFFLYIFHWVTLNELYVEDACGKYTEKRSFRICTVRQILLMRYGGLGIRIRGIDEKCM